MTAPDHRILRLVGAALLLGSGAIHVVLAFDGYGTSTIEDLFLLNGIAAAGAAIAVLVAPGPLAALGGLAVAGGTILALALSRIGDGIVGFRATGLDPSPEVPLTILVEVVAFVVLAALAVREREPLVDLVRSARAEVRS